MTVYHTLTTEEGTPIALPGAVSAVSLGNRHEGDAEIFDPKWFAGRVRPLPRGTPILIDGRERLDPRKESDDWIRRELKELGAYSRAARDAGLSVGIYDGAIARRGTIAENQAARDRIYGGSGGLRRNSDWIAVPCYFDTDPDTLKKEDAITVFSRFADDIQDAYRIADGKPVVAILFALASGKPVRQGWNSVLIDFIKDRGADLMVWNYGDTAEGRDLVSLAVGKAA